MTAEGKVYVIKRVGRVRGESGTRIAVRYLGKNADGICEWYEELTPAVIQGGIEVIKPGVLTYKRQVTVEKVYDDLRGRFAAEGVRDRLEIDELDAQIGSESFRDPLPGAGRAV